jgi:hypothetical protein
MRQLLSALVDIERDQSWEGDGARDLPHWIQMRYGVSNWEARRWLRAAHALEELPRLSDALERGRLCLDKVFKLCRFVTPETETDLIRWASRVSMATVRRRADAEVKRDREDLVDVERSRFLEMWYSDEGRRFRMEAELPAAEGAIVERAIERLMRDVPTMPDEDDEVYASTRRADALVAMASSALGAEGDRAMVVVHAPLAALSADGPGGEIENGPPIAAETVQRLLCTSRFQTVVEDGSGNVVALGERSRLAPAWMQRQVRYRDRECRFPGCGARRFTEAHHTTFWRDGGGTTFENLLLLCGFHHRLVHEHGWSIERAADGEVRWRRPDGTHLRDGPPTRAPTERMIA